MHPWCVTIYIQTAVNSNPSPGNRCQFRGHFIPSMSTEHGDDKLPSQSFPDIQYPTYLNQFGETPSSGDSWSYYKRKGFYLPHMRPFWTGYSMLLVVTHFALLYYYYYYYKLFLSDSQQWIITSVKATWVTFGTRFTLFLHSEDTCSIQHEPGKAQRWKSFRKLVHLE